MPERLDLLAIGVDAAEPALIQRLIDDSTLPAIRQFSKDAEWHRVVSPSDIGSGCVWPTFMTGARPADHGVYGEWAWRPRTMSVERYDGDGVRPFWKTWTDAGVTVGVLDVPFAPLLGVRDGFEIKEWGAHDAFDGRPSAGPDEVSAFLQGFATHPFYSQTGDLGPRDLPALRALAGDCVTGTRLRGELAVDLLRTRQPRAAIITFPELHRAEHHLWHGIAPGHDVYTRLQLASTNGAGEALRDVCREVDRQIGRLVREAGDHGAVMIFSLHGMRPANGVVSFLAPLLCEAGFARLSDWRGQSWRVRARSAFAAIKRRSPPGLKKLYYRTAPATTVRRLAQPTMMPPYDWRHTRAFALPTDQHGWIRVSLAGREAEGSVAPGEYENTCQLLETFLKELSDLDGRRLTDRVIRTASTAEDARRLALPDLVVHWSDAALARPLRIRRFETIGIPVSEKFTGQHALDGFCLWRGPRIGAPGTLEAADLAKMLSAVVRPR